MEKQSRRKRDPERTREAILEAAREVLAQDGKEGVSVAQVAQLAGVNRGTAYQHFQTREQLIEATAAWVGDNLYRAVFGDPAAMRDQSVENVNIEATVEHLATFAMENPALGRIWLFEVLRTGRRSTDRFWRQFESNFRRFAETDLAQPGIDVEVVSVLIIAGSFIWPAWAGSRTRTAKQRQQMAGRLSREVLRLALHGTLRPEMYPELDARVAKNR